MIYVASKEDLPVVLKMAEKAFKRKAKGKDYPEIDPVTLSTVVISNWNTLPVFTFRKEEQIVGCLGLRWITFPWSEEMILGEYFRYAKDYDKDVEKKLIEAVRDFAKLNKNKYFIQDDLGSE